MKIHRSAGAHGASYHLHQPAVGAVHLSAADIAHHIGYSADDRAFSYAVEGVGAIGCCDSAYRRYDCCGSADISPRPTDTCTLIPFLKDMESHLGFKYSEIVADAGYESEENYLFIEGNGQTAYIKPQNYEISKTRKYKKDISRRENMEYHADRDSYICRNGRELTVTNERRSKTASGYVSVKTYYRSPDCTGCPYKTECIKGNNCKTPMEKRNKVLMVSKTMSQKRAEDLERITSEYGTMLRMNRSIQAEGSFADVKEDMNFRRYLYRGKANALAESILLAMGRNINKLHCKIQTGRTGSHLFSLKTA